MHIDQDKGGLPVVLTRLVGRRRELDTLSRLVRTCRLVSVVGTGGCGKTRLCLAAVQECQDRFAAGVWWVDLDPLAGSGLVAGVVAAVLGVVQSPGDDPVALLVRHLRSRDQEMLVVLDNCEHLAAECADLADRLLRSCPRLHIVATSREVIGVSGETVFRVGGLDLPTSGTGPTTSEAVQLFIERVAETDPGYQLDPDEAVAVTDLCQRLDGLPLALELAAARVGVLSVADIVGRLDGDARLLRHPSRNAPARHRTLEATLEWSYGLLTATEQALLRRLSVFQGTFSLLAAEQVGVGDEIDRADIVDLLAALVDKSLVQVADRGVEHRYRLLERVRHYAHERLLESPETAAVHRAYVQFYLQLAGQAHLGLEGPDQLRWLDRLEVDHDNLRAALRCGLMIDADAGAQLTAWLWPFWYRRGYYHEARSWLEEANALADQLDPHVRAQTLTGAGILAQLQCDYQASTERLDDARKLYDDANDRVGVASVLQRLGSVAREQGRYDDARRLHQASRDIWAELGDDAGVAASEDYLGFAAWLEGDFQRAEIHARAAVTYFRAAGKRQETAAALINWGVVAHYQGQSEQAVAVLQEALALSQDIGYTEGTAWAQHELAVASPADPATPGRLREALTTHVQLGDRWRAASVLETIATTALDRNDAKTATQLFGAAHALRQRLGTPLPPAETLAVEAASTSARRALSQPDFSTAWAAGLGSPLDQAVDLALKTMENPPDESSQPDHRTPGDLTDRELAVLRLVSQGLTNREIGQALFISPGTAGVHVSNILRKLDVSSRVQAAGIAHQHGLAD